MNVRKDTSKKIRATWQSKGRSGEHLTTIPPYGYKKDPEDKKQWIVDEEAAAVVQKIFALCMDGMGPTQIAKWLTQSKVLNPTAYAYDKGLPVSNKPPVNPISGRMKRYHGFWSALTIWAIRSISKPPSNRSRARKSCGMTRQNG